MNWSWLHIALSYASLSIALLLYSITQIDANMTISRVGWLQYVQKVFQSVGMTQRPVSVALFLGIIAMLFVLYAIVLDQARTKRMGEQEVWRIVWITSLILLFSYPAFSYDMFNYMFTAKTVLVYKLNPYEVIPLQFSGIDPWTNFMRWTHLPSAYTPLWILMTLPAYIMGFGKLLLTLWSIKLLVLFFHILTAAGIWKILNRIESEHAILGLAIYALNPLVLVENLVSAHNDVVMMAAAVWAVYALIVKKRLLSWFLISVSVALKLMTASLIPVWLVLLLKNEHVHQRLSHTWRVWMLTAMVLGFLAVITMREVLAWYWVWIMPFIALLPARRDLTFISAGISLGLLVRYAPYLYHGHYDPPVQLLKLWVTIIPIILCLVWYKVKTVRQ